MAENKTDEQRNRTDLRILLTVSLYVFLAWAIYTIWRELRVANQMISTRQIPELTLRQPDTNAEPVSFAQSEIIIGRDPDCSYPILDETVSAHHLRLSYHHNQWWVEDLHSTNGSLLNDERITTPTVIMSGDDLRCGKVRLQLIITQK